MSYAKKTDGSTAVSAAATGFGDLTLDLGTPFGAALLRMVSGNNRGDTQGNSDEDAVKDGGRLDMCPISVE
jgi:hypothetical protein